MLSHVNHSFSTYYGVLYILKEQREEQQGLVLLEEGSSNTPEIKGQGLTEIE